MNWLEIVGLIAIAALILGFITDFLDKEEKIQLLSNERNHEAQRISDESRAQKEDYEKWKKENPESVEQLNEAQERTRIRNELVYKRMAEIQKLKQEIFNTRPEERQAILDKIAELKKDPHS